MSNLEAKVLGLDHVSILVSDADNALAFYQELLGLRCLARPPLAFPGYWLDLGAGQSLHLMQLPNPYAGISRPAHGGRDVHFALRVNSIAAFAEKLDQKGLRYSCSQSGRKAIFAHDPDGNAFELFEATE